MKTQLFYLPTHRCLAMICLIVVTPLLVLTSCSHKMTRSSKLKVKELKSKSYYMVPLDATLRQNLVWTDDAGGFHVLSEVSPDAVITSASNVTAKITGDLQSGQKLSAEQATAITQSLNELGKRTVAVSILRDALYRLEEFNINANGKVMDTSTYQLFLEILSCAKTIALADSVAEQAKVANVELAREKEVTKQLAMSGEGGNSNYLLVSQWEKKGFNLLLSDNIDGAIEAFKEAEKIYPTYHNVYELQKILTDNKSKFVNPNSKEAKAVLTTILNQYSWGMDAETKRKLKAKL